MNRFTYLYQNVYYWSMSPHDCNAANIGAHEFLQNVDGNAGAAGVWGTWLGLRPVIKSTIKILLSHI